MKLKDFLAVVGDEEYFELYVVGEDYFVEREDGYFLMNLDDVKHRAYKPYFDYKVSAITTANGFEKPYIQIAIAKEDV